MKTKEYHKKLLLLKAQIPTKVKAKSVKSQAMLTLLTYVVMHDVKHEVCARFLASHSECGKKMDY